MAQGRGFSWGAFFVGALTLFIVAIVAAAIVIFGGLYPVGASSDHTRAVAALIGAARDSGVERAASGITPPTLSQADIREGGSHFKGMCQECHGGPGVKPEEFAAGMNPRPPDLAEATDDLSLSEVFWIAKNGFKMTGMPAFGKTDKDEELWEVAWFVKHMSKVSPAQYAALPNAHERESKEGESPAGEGSGQHDHD